MVVESFAILNVENDLNSRINRRKRSQKPFLVQCSICLADLTFNEKTNDNCEDLALLKLGRNYFVLMDLTTIKIKNLCGIQRYFSGFLEVLKVWWLMQDFKLITGDEDGFLRGNCDKDFIEKIMSIN